MYLYKVGDKYPEFATGQDYLVMSYNEDNGFTIVQFITDPSKKEIRAMRGDLRIGLVVIDEIAYVSLMFDDGLSGDCVFCPGLHKAEGKDDNFTIPQNGDVYGVTLMSFNSANGECLQIRLLGLGQEQSNVLAKLCKDCKPMPRSIYDQRVTQVLTRYTTDQLYRMAVKEGLTHSYHKYS